MSLAEKLVSLRKQKGLTQLDLAERLNVSRQAISRWEVGVAVPSTDNLKVLAELYEVQVDYLLNDDAADFFKSADNAEQDNSEHNSKPRSQHCWKVYSIIISVSVVVALMVIFYVSLGPEEKTQNITPIENMTEEEENDLSPDTFFIDE